MEVAKQLSKDSYGTGQVPISDEVFQLLSAQQEHIAQQEQRLQEFETHLKRTRESLALPQEFTITQVDRRNSHASDSPISMQAVENIILEDNPYSTNKLAL